MAAALLKRLRPDWEVRSAGLAAGPGSRATDHAVEVMRSRGLDLSAHRSQPVSSELLAWADRVLCMTEVHRNRLLAQYPEHAAKIESIPEEVEDPYGGERPQYEQSAAQLERLLGRL